MSAKGVGQKKALRKLARLRLAHGDVVVVSSPKKRCVETVEKLLGSHSVIIDARLDEGRDLEQRVAHFLSWWKKRGPALTVACSHGDWIPEAIHALTGAHVVLKKGGWIEILLEGTKPRIDWIIQEPSALTRT